VHAYTFKSKHYNNVSFKGLEKGKAIAFVQLITPEPAASITNPSASW
jgi:hypothetical protein